MSALRVGVSLASGMVCAAQLRSQDSLTLALVLRAAERRGALVGQATVVSSRAQSEHGQQARALLPELVADAGISWREGRPQIFNGITFGAPSSTLGSSVGIEAKMTVGPSGLALLHAASSLQNAASAEVRAARAETRLLAAASFFDAGLAQSRVALQDSLVGIAGVQLEDAVERSKLGISASYDVNRLRASLGSLGAMAIRARGVWRSAIVRLSETIGRPLAAESVVLILPTVTSADSEPRIVGSDQGIGVEARQLRLRALLAQQRAEGLSRWPTLQAFASTSGFTNSFVSSRYVESQATTAAQSSCYENARVRAIVGQSTDPSACSTIHASRDDLTSALASNRSFPARLSRNPIVAGFAISFPLLDLTGLRRREEARLNALQAAVELARVRDETGTRIGVAAAEYRAAVRALASLTEAAAQAQEAVQALQARNREGLTPLGDVLQARSEYERIALERLVSVADAMRSRFVLDELPALRSANYKP